MLLTAKEYMRAEPIITSHSVEEEIKTSEAWPDREGLNNADWVSRITLMGKNFLCTKKIW